MLCLSDVLGGLWQSLRKNYGKISAENHNRKPLPIETMGRGDLWSGWVGRRYIAFFKARKNKPRKAGVLCEV